MDLVRKYHEQQLNDDDVDEADELIEIKDKVNVKNVTKFLSADTPNKLYTLVNENAVLNTEYVILNIANASIANNEYRWDFSVFADTNVVSLNSPLKNVVSMKISPFIFPAASNFPSRQNRLAIQIKELSAYGYATHTPDKVHFIFIVDSNRQLYHLDLDENELIFNPPLLSIESLTFVFKDPLNTVSITSPSNAVMQIPVIFKSLL